MAKYPEVKVKLSGEDGNAFAVLGQVKSAMRRAGIAQEEISAFIKEATSGNYDELIATCMKWVEVE